MKSEVPNPRDPRIRKGLIPLLIALRIEAQRRQKLALGDAATSAPRKKRGWFG